MGKTLFWILAIIQCLTIIGIFLAPTIEIWGADFLPYLIVIGFAVTTVGIEYLIYSRKC